jgi:hypothetical protein
MMVCCVVGVMARLLPRHRQYHHPGIASATTGSAATPAGAVTAGESNLPPLMVRCVVGALAPTSILCPARHRQRQDGTRRIPDGAVRRPDLPSLTVLSRAIRAFGYTTARGRAGHNRKR